MTEFLIVIRLLLFLAAVSIALDFITQSVCLKHFCKKIITPCTSGCCNHMIEYCPKCGLKSYIDYSKGLLIKYDPQSGCIQHRPEDEEWDKVPSWKKSDIENTELSIKLKGLKL